MKKQHILLLFTVMVMLIGSAILIDKNHSDNSNRTAHEQFLNEQYKSFPTFNPDEIEDMPKLDRPDLAGFSDFIKTLDPELQAVPTWRLNDAYRDIQSQAKLKSGNGTLEWSHHRTDMGGRTRALMFDPNDPANSKVWAGSVTGGLWWSDDPFHNAEWTPVDDFWPNLSISSLAYDPINTNIFYAGTGESQTALIIYRESSGRGSGIMKSSDAGATWDVIPSTSEWAYVNDIIVRNEDGQSVIYAGVVSGYYKGKLHEAQPTDGLYRSSNGGDSWTQVLPNIPGVDIPYAPSDIVMSSDNNRIFVGTTYHGEERRGAACILYSDNGIDWTVNDTYNNLIEAESTNKYPGRVMMCNAPSDANTLFALVASGYERINSHSHDDYVGYDCKYLLKSTDKGQSWTQLNFPSNFAYLAWHALVVQVSPVNPNVIWVGGLDCHRSTNGGNTWTKMSNWARMYSPNGDLSDYVHADIHVFKFRPGSDTDMLIATDGGIFGTTLAPASNVSFSEKRANFSTLQYYSGAIHPLAGSEHFIGGLQDNGTMSYRKNHIPTFGDMLSGGDGALCFIDEDTPELQITTVYHNSIRTWYGAVETKPSSMAGRNDGSGTFINPMDYSSRDNTLFANMQDWEGNDANKLLIAGISASNVNFRYANLNTETAVPFSCIKSSERSPVGESNIFIGTEAGRLYKLADATRNTNVQEITSASFPSGFISSIEVGETEQTLLVTFSNYGVESVWLSLDGGQNWTNKEGNLPDIPVRWSIFHPENDKQVMLATELGSWTCDDITADPAVWTQNINGLANVRIDQIKVRKSDNTVLAATHGRGMYTAVWNKVTGSGIDNYNLSTQMLAYPNPSNGQFKLELRPAEDSELVISDLTGRVVLHEALEAQNYSITKTFDLSQEPKGTYIITVSLGSKKQTAKVLIQ